MRAITGLTTYGLSLLAPYALVLAATAMVPSVSGCGAGATVEAPARIDTPETRYAKEGKRIEADPVAYLRDVYEHCDALEQYRLLFYRQERLGTLFPTLGPMEEIRATFRKDPFSVKFEWDDPRSSYCESVYVAGRSDNKLIVRERHGIFPFPPQVRIIDPSLPAKIGKARNPITNFGLAQVTRRILRLFDDPELVKVLTTGYRGLVDLEPMHRPAHHLRIEQLPFKGYRHTQRDFYIDAETLLPAGVDLWLKPGQLDARYRYTAVDAAVTLTDADFRLSKDHPESEENDEL